MFTNRRPDHRSLTTLALLLLLPGTAALAGGTITPQLSAELALSPAETAHVVWVELTDKGRYEALRAAVPSSVVTERSLRRRAKVRELPALVDYTDLPVDPGHLSTLAAEAAAVRHTSRWFNAVTLYATRAQVERIAALPFVRSVDRMARYGRRTAEPVDAQGPVAPPGPPSPASPHLLDYGASLTQVSQINVPTLHDGGLNGTGVMVGVFDNGFRLPNHESFATMTIAATYDFVDYKVSVVPRNPSTSFGAHGVNTLSTIGGYKPGQLIGPAYGATYILARTENDSSETPLEEDKWIAAIEWADSLGVEVTSTSLSYLAYDPPYTSWTWQDMNGNATRITRAADMAVARGIVVVNSAGNDGSSTRNTLGAPADGDSVLTIGAVTSTGARSSFSSVGPTTSAPPRIKPDVMAMGSSVRVASATSTTGYGLSSGTSFSCPLAAGVVAMILQARPNATPMQVVNALRSTGSNAGSPNNQMGWGIINAVSAVNSVPLPIQLAYLRAEPAGPDSVLVRWGTLTEVNNYGFEVEKSRFAASGFATIPGSFVEGAGTIEVPRDYRYVDAAATGGLWYYRLKQIDLDRTVHYTEPVSVTVTGVTEERGAAAFALQQNYPNPFNPSTLVRFELPSAGLARLALYDGLGREVMVLASGELPAGPHEVTLQASGLSSGTYFCRLSSQGRTAVVRMVLLK